MNGFDIHDAIPAREPDCVYSPTSTLSILAILAHALLVVALLVALAPWLMGALSWVGHRVVPMLNDYCEWAYRTAGGS